MEQEVYKKYVQVDATFTEDGKLLPLCVVWEDGRKFEIDRVKQCVRQQAGRPVALAGDIPV